MQTTYKFTDPGRRPTHGINDYPEVGEWSDSRTPVLCESGWHTPTRQGLSAWLAAELWEVEVDGASVSQDDKAAHERIRFVRKVEAWTPQTAADFAAFCAERAQTHADRSATTASYAANAAYADRRAAYAAYTDAYAAYDAAVIAARAAADAAADAAYAAYAYAAADAATYAARYADEREAQAAWLCERLGLEVSE